MGTEREETKSVLRPLTGGRRLVFRIAEYLGGPGKVTGTVRIDRPTVGRKTQFQRVCGAFVARQKRAFHLPGFASVGGAGPVRAAGDVSAASHVEGTEDVSVGELNRLGNADSRSSIRPVPRISMDAMEPSLKQFKTALRTAGRPIARDCRRGPPRRPQK